MQLLLYLTASVGVYFLYGTWLNASRYFTYFIYTRFARIRTFYDSVWLIVVCFLFRPFQWQRLLCFGLAAAIASCKLTALLL